MRCNGKRGHKTLKEPDQWVYRTVLANFNTDPFYILGVVPVEGGPTRPKRSSPIEPSNRHLAFALCSLWNTA